MSKFKSEVYEYIDKNGRRHTGTAKGLSKKTNTHIVTIYTHAIKTGTQWEEFEAYDKIKREVIVGTIEDVTEALNLSSSHSIRNALKRGGNMRDYQVKLTGNTIFVPEGSNRRIDKYEQLGIKPKLTGGQVKLKPIYTHKPVPMSEYAKQLFEHSTRHLRRDA